MLEDKTGDASGEQAEVVELSIEQKLAYCAQWKESGLSKKAFCKEKNITMGSFHYWYHQLYMKKSSQWSPVIKKSQPLSQMEERLQIEVALPNQVTLRLSILESHVVVFIQELSGAITIIR